MGLLYHTLVDPQISDLQTDWQSVTDCLSVSQSVLFSSGSIVSFTPQPQADNYAQHQDYDQQEDNGTLACPDTHKHRTTSAFRRYVSPQSLLAIFPIGDLFVNAPEKGENPRRAQVLEARAQLFAAPCIVHVIEAAQVRIDCSVFLA